MTKKGVAKGRVPGRGQEDMSRDSGLEVGGSVASSPRTASAFSDAETEGQE